MPRSKIFASKELPSELQNRILLLAIGERSALQAITEPAAGAGDYPRVESCLPHTHGYKFPSGYDVPHREVDVTIPHVPRLQTALFRLDKATRARALQVLRQDAVHVATDPSLYRNPLPELSSFLSKLEIAWTSLDYINFLWVKVAPFFDRGVMLSSIACDEIPSASVLSCIPNLRELNMNFRSTAYSGDSPWWPYYEYGIGDPWRDHTYLWRQPF